MKSPCLFLLLLVAAVSGDSTIFSDYTAEESATITEVDSTRKEFIENRINSSDEALNGSPNRLRLIETLENSTGNYAVLLTPEQPLDHSLTFLQDDSYLSTYLPDFPLNEGYEFSFSFRTDRPYGLLALFEHGNDIEVRVYLSFGNLKISIRNGALRTVFTSRKNLIIDDEWHLVELRMHLNKMDSTTLSIDKEDGDLKMEMGHLDEDLLSIPTLSEDLKLWLGGHPGEIQFHHQPFHGCLREVSLRLESIPKETVLTSLPATEFHGVSSDRVCPNSCAMPSPCPSESSCRNHFSHATCDCSETDKAGDLCDSPDDRVLILRGDGHLRHSLYDWQNISYSEGLSFSLDMKTSRPDSLIMMALNAYNEIVLGNPNKPEYLAVVIDSDGRLKVHSSGKTKLSVDHEEYSEEEIPITDNEWHHIKVSFEPNSGEVLWRPNIYFGASPELSRACNQPFNHGYSHCANPKASRDLFFYDPPTDSCQQSSFAGCGEPVNFFDTMDECLQLCLPIPELKSRLPFIGCLRHVYVEGKSVLHGLSTESTEYTGISPVEKDACVKNQDDSLSLATSRSQISVPAGNKETPNELFLRFEVKPYSTEPVLNSSYGELLHGTIENSLVAAQWILFTDGKFIYYKLNEEDILLKTESVISDNEWHTVILKQKQEDIKTIAELSVDGQTVSGSAEITSTFSPIFNFGSTMSAMRSCIRKVQIGGKELDLRRFQNPERGVLLNTCQNDDSCQSLICKHGGRCSITDTGAPSCDCSGTDFEGNLCQFEKYPSSCSEYGRHGFKKSGKYLVDIDGLGLTKAFPVECEFDEESTQTTLSHNLSPEHVVRKEGMKDYKLHVDYQGLSSSQLEKIVQRSTSCSQDIKFDCRRSALKLSSLTWFSSPNAQMFSSMEETGGSFCPCHNTLTCVQKNIGCNCDASDDKIRTDSGTVVKDDHLPITSLSFVMNKMEKSSMTNLTLGDLVCQTKNEQEDIISILSQFSPLEFHHVKSPLRSLGLAFRTPKTFGIILHIPAVINTQGSLTITLVEGNVLQVDFSYQYYHRRTTFNTSHPINFSSWQHIWVDFTPTEIRVYLNGHKQFITLPSTWNPTLETPIFVGGFSGLELPSRYQPSRPEGLNACYKKFVVNGEKVSLSALAKTAQPSDSYRIGCQLSCHPNPCKNDGICEETGVGKYKCICKNKYAHSGENCQQDLNKNSISLLSPLSALSYKFNQNQTEPKPLNEDITISFRTRDVQALLLFAKDDAQNVLQLYMSSPFHVSLIWNNMFRLFTITVHTGKTALNMGDEVQVFVQRSKDSTSLTLFINGKTFTESVPENLKLLSPSQYQETPFGSPVPHRDLTIYRVTRHYEKQSPTLNVGAVWSSGFMPKIPGLVGCLSGLKIGNLSLDVTDLSIWEYDGLDHENGCHLRCSAENPCHHGGRCLNSFSRHTDEQICECAGTSYTGPTCNDEVSYVFDAESSVAVDVSYPFFNEPFTIELAFAVSPPGMYPDDSQTLLLYSKKDHENEPMFGISLFESNSLHLVGPSSRGISKWSASVDRWNLNDGNRHRLQITYSDEPTGYLDGLELDLELLWEKSKKRKESGEATIGMGGPLENSPQDWGFFEGCVSNVQVYTKTGKMLEPLKDYRSGVKQKHVIGMPTIGSCSAFPIEHVATSYVQNYAAFEAGNDTLLVGASNPQQEHFTSLEKPDIVVSSKQGFSTAGKIGAVFMAAVFVMVLVYLFKINKAYHEKQRQHYEMVKARESNAENV